LDRSSEKKYEFLNLIFNSVLITDEEGINCKINLNKYFKHRIFKNLSENFNKILVRNLEEFLVEVRNFF